MTREEFKEEALRVRPQLLSVARHYLGDDDAEDVVQDVLLRLWQMVGEVCRPMDGLASVLTRNLSIDRLRRQQPTTNAALSPSLAEAMPVGNDERIDRMMGIIDELPSIQQTILRLRHIEVLDLIGSNEVAIRKALSRARQSVRTQYVKRYER